MLLSAIWYVLFNPRTIYCCGAEGVDNVPQCNITRKGRIKMNSAWTIASAAACCPAYPASLGSSLTGRINSFVSRVCRSCRSGTVNGAKECFSTSSKMA
jgi:hypothetical protein